MARGADSLTLESTTISMAQIERQKIHNRIFFVSLLALSAAIPSYANLINLASVVLALNWMVEGNFNLKLKLFRQNPIFSLFILFYLFHVVSLLYSQNPQQGISDISQKIGLLVFPLVLGSTAYRLTKKQEIYVLLSFVISCLIISLVCLGYGLYKLQTFNTNEYLFYEGLTKLIFPVQPIYYAIYVCFATAILLFLLGQDYGSRMKQITIIVLILYFFCYLLLLMARTAILANSIILCLGGLYYAHKRGGVKWLYGLAFTVLTTGILMIYKIDFLNERITSIINSKLYFDPQENNANGLTLRLVKWECSLKGIANNPIIGVGIGDAQDFLQECYKSKNFWGHVYRFNSHNQYLQTTLGLGIIGLVILICTLTVPMHQFFKQKDYLYLWFLILITIVFVTESVLERKQGIIFYSFFNSFLAYRSSTIRS